MFRDISDSVCTCMMYDFLSYGFNVMFVVLIKNFVMYEYYIKDKRLGVKMWSQILR
jgi:hypothetical protein